MACRHCHEQKIKCVSNPGTNSCERCIKKGLHCTPHHSRQGRRTRTDLQGDKEDNDVEEENQLVWSVSGGAHLGDSEPKSSCSKSDTTIVREDNGVEEDECLTSYPLSLSLSSIYPTYTQKMDCAHNSEKHSRRVTQEWNEILDHEAHKNSTPGDEDDLNIMRKYTKLKFLLKQLNTTRPFVIRGMNSTIYLGK